MTELLSTSTETALYDIQVDTDTRASSPPPLLPEDVMMCESYVTHDHILTQVSMTTQLKLSFTNQQHKHTFYHNYI